MSPEMLTREIGVSGISASAIGLGTWAIGGWMWGGTDEAQSIDTIQASIDEGVSLIDTAPAYGKGLSEEIVGKAIKGRRERSFSPRSWAWSGTRRRAATSSTMTASPCIAISARIRLSMRSNRA